MTIQLHQPTIQDKAAVLAYKEEFLQNLDDMAGTAGLRTTDSYETWLQWLADNGNEATVHEGLVPASTFLAKNEHNELVGMIDIRHSLSPYLLAFGGHIGYSVKKAMRRQGHATKMLALALDECKKMNLDQVLITCNKENIASAKTIMANGGVLENEVQDGDDVTQRYWIVLGQ